MAQCAVLIVNWNSWELVSQGLSALSRQTFRDFQVFVADNASDQPPPCDISSILPGTVLVSNDCNYGFAVGNNRLLELVTDSEWVVLLNPDAFPEPDWLEQLVHAAKENQGYSFFASRLLSYDNPEILDGEGDTYHISGLAWRGGHGKPVSENSTPREVFSPCGAAAMYRTKAILAMGGFDEDFFCYMEDVDLGFRLRLAGYRCLLVPSAQVRHVGSATSGGDQSDFVLFHGHRNLVWTFVKNMPPLLFWPLLPYHLTLNIYCIYSFCMRGHGKIIFKAKWDAIKGIPQMLRKRKVIQANRVASVRDIWHSMDRQFIFSKAKRK